MEHTDNQKQHQRDDDNDKESTSSSGNDGGSSTSSKPKDILHDDVCSICFDDVSMLDITTFTICTQCGKVMHMKCSGDLLGAKGVSIETRNSCPMCRAPDVATGSKEYIERLQKWSLRKKS